MSVFAYPLKGLQIREYAKAPLSQLVLRALLFGLLICWQSGFASATEPQQPPTYLIGPGDVLKITVRGDPELSTSTTVRPDGRISVPLVDDVPAAGKTPEELAAVLKDALSKYRVEPVVTVAVVSGLGDLSQQVRIIGESAAPHALAYRSGMTLLDAIIAAGGLSPNANGNGAVIQRHEDGVSSEIPVRLSDLVDGGDSSANVALMPGDVIVIPESFLAGDWRVDYRASASETFSDNIDLDPKGSREAGLVTRAGPGITISGSSARVTAAFNGDIFGVYQVGGSDEGFSADPSMDGVSTTELLPNTLFFDLSGSVHREVLDTRQATSNSNASTSNRDLVAAFSASPYLVHQLGDFADAEWRYRISPVFVDSSGHSDSLSQDVSAIFNSGSDFSSLGWTFTNRAGLEDRSNNNSNNDSNDGGTIKTASTDLGFNYALWDGFALISGVGYEYRQGDNEDGGDNFNDVTWRGGFQYDPDPDFSLQATYGHRNGDDNADASLTYRVSPKTTLTASYKEALETSQNRAVNDLTQTTIDPNTGEIVDVRADSFTFQDETTRTHTLRVGATHTDGRNTFALSAVRGTSTGGSDGDEDFYSARFTWSRDLSEELSFNTSASYRHSHFDEDSRTDDTYRVNLGLDYDLTANTQAFMSYSFQTRDSSDPDEEFLENAVTIGVTASY